MVTYQTLSRKSKAGKLTNSKIVTHSYAPFDYTVCAPMYACADTRDRVNETCVTMRNYFSI
jgi:hypothetical protein